MPWQEMSMYCLQFFNKDRRNSRILVTVSTLSLASKECWSWLRGFLGVLNVCLKCVVGTNDTRKLIWNNISDKDENQKGKSYHEHFSYLILNNTKRMFKLQMTICLLVMSTTFPAHYFILAMLCPVTSLIAKMNYYIKLLHMEIGLTTHRGLWTKIGVTSNWVLLMK